jgi:hypothetical protein
MQSSHRLRPAMALVRALLAPTVSGDDAGERFCAPLPPRLDSDNTINLSSLIVSLGTHFEAAKVMTFAPVTQHFSVSTALCHTKQNIFFFYERARNRSKKDREREDTDFAQYSRKEVVVLDVLESSPCVYINVFVLK